MCIETSEAQMVAENREGHPREGRQVTRDELIEGHLDLPRVIAWSIAKRTPAAMDDLVSDGYLGLIKAAESFDGIRASFKTFAGYRIRGEILDGMRTRARWEGWMRTHVAATFVPLVEVIDEREGPFDRACRRERCAQTEARLRPRQVRIFRMVQHGYTYPEIGVRLGVSPTRIAQLMHVVRRATLWG